MVLCRLISLLNLFQCEPHRMEFKEISSTSTELMKWGASKTCILNNTDIVFYGRENKDNPPGFFIYSAQGELKKSIPRVCHHEVQIKLVALLIQGEEYLCVACNNEGCDKIYAIHLSDGAVSVAYQSKWHYPGHICLGEPGVMYVHHCLNVNDRPVLQMDCSKIPFVHTRTIQSGMENIYDVCYTNKPQKMLLFSNWPTNNIQAVDSITGAPLWQVQGEVAGVVCRPSGMACLTNGRIIVADAHNKRLLVLNAENGKVLYTQTLSNCEVADKPYVVNNEGELVLCSYNQSHCVITLFKIT